LFIAAQSGICRTHEELVTAVLVVSRPLPFMRYFSAAP
jgi:hypothetical protein